MPNFTKISRRVVSVGFGEFVRFGGWGNLKTRSQKIMTEEAVVRLMKGSKDLNEWNDNCVKVKKSCGGYPNFWYKTIVLDGVMRNSQSRWGKT